MITPEIMIWMARRFVRSFLNGRRSPYPTVVMDSTTKSSALVIEIGFSSRRGYREWNMYVYSPISNAKAKK
jgi:hypothetical protein